MDRNKTRVAIPADVADEIEDSRKAGAINEHIISDVLNEEYNDKGTLTLRSIPFDTLLSALINGYEREKTEAERHAEILAEVKRRTEPIDAIPSVSDVSFLSGVQFTLNKLGIKIEGINGGVR